LADLFTMTIPNRLSLALIGAYFLLAIYLRIPLETIALHVSCGLAMLLLTFMMFHFAGLAAETPSLPPPPRCGWGGPSF